MIVEAHDRGVFPTLDEAVATLHFAAERNKRARLRQLAHLVDELDGCLHAPGALSQRNVLHLAEAGRRDFAELIRATLAAVGRAEAPAQWDLIAPILAEAEATRRHAPTTPRASPRPATA